MNFGVLVESRSAAAPLMYKKRNGDAGPASCIARRPAMVYVWQMCLTSSKSYVFDFDGVIATVLGRVKNHC